MQFLGLLQRLWWHLPGWFHTMSPVYCAQSNAFRTVAVFPCGKGSRAYFMWRFLHSLGGFFFLNLNCIYCVDALVQVCQCECVCVCVQTLSVYDVSSPTPNFAISHPIKNAMYETAEPCKGAKPRSALAPTASHTKQLAVVRINTPENYSISLEWNDGEKISVYQCSFWRCKRDGTKKRERE